jgi:hypothetical protein
VGYDLGDHLDEVGERYGLALLLLGVIYLIGAIALPWMPVLTDVLLIIVLLLVVRRGALPAAMRKAAYVAAVVSIAGSIPRAFSDTRGTVAVDAASTLMVLLIAVAAVLLKILRQTRVDIMTVFGAVLSYILIAFAFASLYELVQATAGVPFFAEGAQPPKEFVYFSIITQTTVGFGDLTPAGDFARRVVAVQALAGQIFLVVLVARLVSLWSDADHRASQALRREDDRDRQ